MHTGDQSFEINFVTSLCLLHILISRSTFWNIKSVQAKLSKCQRVKTTPQPMVNYFRCIDLKRKICPVAYARLIFEIKSPCRGKHRQRVISFSKIRVDKTGGNFWNWIKREPESKGRGALSKILIKKARKSKVFKNQPSRDQKG